MMNKTSALSSRTLLWISLFGGAFIPQAVMGDVVINEISADATQRLLHWSDDGTPRVGSGYGWFDPAFDISFWKSGPAPIGFSFGDIATDVSSEMRNITPSLYMRKAFNVSSGQAASTTDLTLEVDYDDGFVAYINGVEVARCNTGAPGGHLYADQPSYNGGGTIGTGDTFNLGDAQNLLTTGSNVLAIQIHNEDLGSSVRGEARLTFGGGTTLVAKSQTWDYFVGVAEPSGGVYEPFFLGGGKAPLNVAWGLPTFDDSAWPQGAGPIGYETSSGYALGTNLESQMLNITPSVYMRQGFSMTAAEVAGAAALELEVDYDDGFVAYLNGIEIARRNLGSTGQFIPRTQPTNGGHNASTDGGALDSSLIEVISIDPSLLSEGNNVFSAQLHNSGTGSSDLILVAEVRTTGAGAQTLVQRAGTWRYFVGTSEPSAPPEGDGGSGEPEFADWIELHNNGGAAVNLAGWSLSDSSNNPGKWKFPFGTEIAAGEYLLVIADGRATANSQTTYLHTNFSLSASGEDVGLYNASGIAQSQIPGGYPKQTPFQSYGLPPGGGTSYGFLDLSTPGQPNTGNHFPGGRVDTPDFSLDGGFYSGDEDGSDNDTITLALTNDTPGATIRYTTDGTEPTETNGLNYTAPLELARVSTVKGHCIRAKGFAPGMLPSRARTRTYLVRQRSLLLGNPALAFSGDEEQIFFKPHGIMAIEGGTYVDSQWQANGKDSYNIPNNRGRAFERPFYMEYFYPDGRPGARGDAGIRLSSSGYSRPRLVLDQTENTPWPNNSTDKPSFNLYFRGDYGDSVLEHDFFPEEYPVSSFEQLRIRAGKNDINNPYIRDEFIRRLFIDMGHQGSRGTFCSMYLNGNLKGFFNLAERLREPFMQSHHNSDASWDVRQVWDTPNGTTASWNELNLRTGRDLSIQANWDAAIDYLDLDNMIDYWLLNIYGSMWDWPNNNWVGARERSEEGKWRFYVWDAEGCFGLYGTKNANYNSIGNDLLGGGLMPNIFAGLYTSDEFKLRFADRINKFMFNGGILDDRGSSPTVREVKDQLVGEFQNLRKGVLGTSSNLDQSWYNNWVNPTNGRRKYLFDGGSASFQNYGLWPNTQPPTFSQFGGEVAPNFNLTIAQPGSSGNAIYYTTDGTDPRDWGGAIAAGAQSYSNPGVPLSDAYTKVMARVRTAAGEWSALTEAEFLVGTEAPSDQNLVIAEFHYNPADASSAEAAAGFTEKTDFEFLQIFNISSSPVDLTGLRFTSGIDFMFDQGSIRAINPGGYVIVAKNRGAFEARYGASLGTLVAGEYAGKLSNGGETIRLEDGAGAVIREFAYGDKEPWPENADGEGASLILLNPTSNPDHSLASNWTGSANLGGTPGGSAPTMNYDTWREYQFDPTETADDLYSGPEADADGDGISNYLEYVLGGNPESPSGEEFLPQPGFYTTGGDDYLMMEVRMIDGTSGTMGAEISSDHVAWRRDTGAVLQIGSPEPNGDGSVTIQFRDISPLGDPEKRRFIRAWFTE